MTFRKVISVLMVIVVLGLMLSFGFVQADTQVSFGNLNSNNTWNLSGGVVVASQFTITDSTTITWMSVLAQDNAWPSFIRLGIFSDNNNQPYECLASTNEFPSKGTADWCSYPLLQSVTLQAGTYWLAEVDSGAGVDKFIFSPGSALTVYSSSGDGLMDQLNVGSQFSTTGMSSVGGTLAIYASSDTPSIPGSVESSCLR